MTIKSYLDYTGLKRVLKHLLPGARKIWHGTAEEWHDLSDEERNKYDQAEVVDGGSIDTRFVRRPAWNQAVAISAEQLQAGYTAPSDGMFVCACFYSTTATITVNNVVVSKSFLTEQPNTGVRNSSTGTHLCVPVSKSDTIKSDVIIQSEPTYYNIAFIPFEDSTVSDIEVVTPEYIRNQNILSDWESITISTSSSSPTVMPYDGFIYLSTGHNIHLYINTVLFPITNHNNIAGDGACMVAVRKGDKVYINGDINEDNSIERVAYYKLRDYTGR